MERQSERVTTAYFSPWYCGKFLEVYAEIIPAAAIAAHSLIPLALHPCNNNVHDSMFQHKTRSSLALLCCVLQN